MQLANPLRLGAFGLLALLFAQTATAEWLDRIFRPAAFEELVGPANESQELPPPPEPLPPTATEESVLEQPEFSDGAPVSPNDRAPYEMERPSAAPAPIPWQEGDALPFHSQPYSGHPHGHGSHGGYDAHYGLSWDGHGDGPDQNACCEKPRIKYWNHPLLAKEICSCHLSEELTIVLTVPTECCSVEVPVCVTACCDSVPEYECDRDLLGRKTHEYCWPCGQRVKIVDRHTGTLVVHTFQRE